jgi:hypothetical protein
MQSACAVLHCHLWPLWLYRIFRHYFTNVTVLGKNLLSIKRVPLFFLQSLSDTFLILGIIQRDIRNVKTSSKVHIFVRLSSNMNFLDTFSENAQISDCIKIRLMEARFSHTGGRTDRQRNMKKLVVAFHNFANASKQSSCYSTY